MTHLFPTQSRFDNRPPVPMTRGVRVVASADLRRMHLLLLAVLGMEVIDLTINLIRLWR
jgi:hypothetical protein